MKCRVFKLDVGWGYGLFHFPLEIEGIMVKQDLRTKHIKKEDYIGTFDFDEQYLNVMESDTLHHDLKGEMKYYFLYYMIT
jgi:hypothetical protein